MKQLSFLNSLLGQVGNVESLEQSLVLYKSVGMSAASKSQKTRIEYVNDIQDLVSYLAASGITKPAQVTLAHLRIYQAELERREYKASTRNRKTYAIKDFFSFLGEYALIKEDIARQIVPPPVERGEPRFLFEGEYKRLLEACASSPRDAAIIELLLQTGIRLSELVSLTLRDVELPAQVSPDYYKAGMMRIRRGQGYVSLPLNHKACRALESWLEARPTTADDALFLSTVGKSIGKRAVQLMLEKYLAQIGIEHASVQTLRHTMAVHHLARGTDIKTLADILGDRPDTLEVYLSAARKIHEKALQENAL